jgi:hypothetical protein
LKGEDFFAEGAKFMRNRLRQEVKKKKAPDHELIRAFIVLVFKRVLESELENILAELSLLE